MELGEVIQKIIAKNLFVICIIGKHFYDDADSRRERLSLEKEIEINMTAPAKIIGLTLETRPDHVTAREIELLRKYNCTRVQIGIQHTDKKILSKINRGCYIDDAKGYF